MIRRCARKRQQKFSRGQRRSAVFLLAAFLGSGISGSALAQTQTGQSFTLPKTRAWTGDLAAIQKRHSLRILVPYSKTLFFINHGQHLGVVAEFGRALEEAINARHKPGELRLHVTFLPTARDQLFDRLNRGYGDIIAGNLTVTPESQRIAEFTAPWLTSVREIVVTGPTAPSLKTIEDLSGHEVHVRLSSHYAEHLAALNTLLVAKGLKPVTIVAIDDNLEDEDLIEMVNAGLLPFAIIDDHIARIWTRIFPKIVPRTDLAIFEGGTVAWAVRKDSPELKALLDAFFTSHQMGTSFGSTISRRYFSEKQSVKNALDQQEAEKFIALMDIFRRYGAQYNFDYLMIAAQAYQESKLDQSRHGAGGAVGLMQIKAATAAAQPIGITGIERDPSRNVQAGCAYLRYLADTYLSDPAIDPVNRTLMSLVAYNAGPGQLKKFRAAARLAGLNPNIWFNNVELGAAQEAGLNPVQYVRNIYMYYISYKLAIERLAATKKARSDAGL